MSSQSHSSASRSEKRALPSWASATKSGIASDKKKQNSGDPGSKEQGDKDHRPGRHKEGIDRPSKLMEGVVFALSGFVNPERGTLRSQAMEMGADYRPDWSPDCTLLVCAFSNTPKFRQVEADCGTIVSKEWILECYKERRLVEIDPYLLHAGKPWRKTTDSQETGRDKNASSRKPLKKVDKKEVQQATPSTIPKDTTTQSLISPTKVKKWAGDDLKETISWLENQDEKPEPDQVKKIAAEGIITCLQDAIEALEQNQDIGGVMDEWMFVPRVVKKLTVLENSSSREASLSKEELTKLAISCKQMYTTEFDQLMGSPARKTPKKGEVEESEREMSTEGTGADSDATIEMTEEEIDLAYRGVLM